MNKLLIFFLIIIFFKKIIFLSANNETYINTTNITYDEKNNIVELAEDSKVNIGNTNILVDKGIIDYENDSIEIFGNFYLYQELNILSGKDLIGNTSLDNFTANEVSYIYNNDLKIDSESSERSGNLVYFYNNFLTPCELEGFFNCPTWSLRIDETRYDIEKDKFNHYDTFLQIADYKVFYIPYLSHYGVRAPRQKGFLTPTLEFNFDGNLGIITPYYYPIDQSTEVLFKPKFIFDNDFRFLDQYSLDTNIKHRNSGGNLMIDIHNKKFKNNTNVYSSVKLKADQTLNKNNKLSFQALATNSVSTTRSINEESVTFEDVFVRLESYDVIYKTDYLKSEISTVEALDRTKSGLIPLSPSIKYSNQKFLKNNLTINNQVNLTNLKRNESKLNKPSDSLYIKFDNSISSNNTYKKIDNYNKFTIINNFGEYSYQHNPNLNDEVFNSYLIFSSDNFIKFKNVKPRLKFVTNLNLVSDNIINEDSRAITFNYLNQFSDSRFYGSDLEDNTTRFIYGLENKIKIFNKYFDINTNQSYDFKKSNNYSNLINQTSNFSDIAFETKTSFENFSFKIDTRLDNNDLEKKEMNYYLDYYNKIDLSINYNETNALAYKDVSTDTQSLGLNLGKKINENIKISFDTNLNLKDNYNPLTQSFNLTLFDECSRLDISYKDIRFNDSYNTKPSETISISFHMDYLGFFGYEQERTLLFDQPGDFNYGL